MNGIEGVHFVRNTREQFAGIEITGENKRKYINAFAQDYIKEHKDKVEAGEISEEELLNLGMLYGKEHVTFNQKMFRAHWKGQTFFRWRGKKERVLTKEYLSRMQKFMKDMEEQYVKENQSNQQEEE